LDVLGCLFVSMSLADCWQFDPSALWWPLSENESLMQYLACGSGGDGGGGGGGEVRSDDLEMVWMILTVSR